MTGCVTGPRLRLCVFNALQEPIGLLIRGSRGASRIVLNRIRITTLQALHFHCIAAAQEFEPRISAILARLAGAQILLNHSYPPGALEFVVLISSRRKEHN